MTTIASPELDTTTFVREFLARNRPVLVRDALADWPWAPPWDLDTLDSRFGHLRAATFDTLFGLRGLTSVGGFLSNHTGEAAGEDPPYLRWFSRQSEERFPWADEAFAALAKDWSAPDWLPSTGYVLPSAPDTLDPTLDGFPARGLFICGRGARTRLHVDPWGSDALLCQALGTKHVTMFAPASAADLTADGAVVDLAEPDDARFPNWRLAEPSFDELLHPGDAVFIPGGWYHTVVAQEDSVSLTWNFVHGSSADRFERFLAAGGGEDATIRYFLGDRS